MNRVDDSQHNALSLDGDKAIRLFTYLKELCALRTPQVRDVATYDQVFWFRDLPRNKLCRCTVWRLTDPLPPTSEQPHEPWIEVRKPTLKSPPELPDELEPWIKDDELANSSLEKPGFYEQIPLSVLQGDSDNTDPNAFASVNNHPQVLDMLANYIDEKWNPWANEDRELQKVQKAYNQLFNIYQRQEKLGEQYEVIVGTGLLLWKSPNSGEIKRHILAIQARIEFDRVRGIMTVGPPLDGPQPMLECSMLEIADRPNPTDLTDIENDAKDIDGDPWDVVTLESVLRGFANALPTAGDYSPPFDHARGASAGPVVNLAPALILRKRTHRTFEDFYRQIIDQIKEGEEIPENIRRIIDIVDDSPDEGPDGAGIEKDLATPRQSDTELYFPLPANDEQKRIVQKVEHRRGVLVQGPPGTGKSHTICNLIAHFLAKGKRVLVTSETPRALEVLRHKLHKDIPEIEELCVVWLGAGPDSQKALEKSVLGITQRKANWNASEELSLTDQFVRRLDTERKEQARLHHDLRACRESDVYQHSSVFGRYSGTLQQIALQINQERDRFQWFVDRPRDAIDPSVTADALLKMARIRRKLTPELAEQLRYRLFPLEQLVQPNEFCRLVDAEKKANLAHKEAQNERAYPGYRQLSNLDRARRGAVKAIVEGILARQGILSKHFHSWAERASREISGDQDRVWRHVFASTVDHIDRIEHLLNEHGTSDVTGLDDKDLRLVEEHAAALKKHFERGKGLGFWLLRTRVVKDGLYLVKSVTVNGKPCNNLQALNQLSAWIEISTRIQSLGELWKSITTPPTGNAVLQCSAYRDMCKVIEHALSLHDYIEEIRRACSDCVGVHFPAWHSQEEVKAFYRALNALNIEEDLNTAQRVFSLLADSIADFVNSGHCHPSTEQLQQAVRSRDSELYRHTFETLSFLSKWAKACDFYRNPDAALAELWETLERLKITPRHSWDSDRKRTETETTMEECIQVTGTAEEYREKIVEDTEENEEEREDESSSREDSQGRLDHALAYARSQRRRPEEMPPLDIQNAILHSLEKCPNHSCTLKSLTSRALKELGVSTRGNPRLEFEKRVMRNLGALRRKGLIEEYKAKNRRIRLAEASQDSMLFH